MDDTKHAIAIKGKKYWPHVVELAKDIKKWQAEVKCEKEKQDLTKMVNQLRLKVRSLGELLD